MALSFQGLQNDNCLQKFVSYSEAKVKIRIYNDKYITSLKITDLT